MHYSSVGDPAKGARVSAGSTFIPNTTHAHTTTRHDRQSSGELQVLLQAVLVLQQLARLLDVAQLVVRDAEAAQVLEVDEALWDRPRQLVVEEVQLAQVEEVPACAVTTTRK